MSHAEPTTSLRFDCPACGVTLTLPSAAAGVQGPCPKCWQEIVSPDPARGLGAELAQTAAAATPEPAPPPAPPEAATAPPPPPQQPPSPAPPETEPQLPPAIPAPTRRIGWLMPSLFSAVVFAGTGYFLGKNQRPLPDPGFDLRSKAPEAPPVDPANEQPPVPAPSSGPKPEPVAPPAAEKPVEPAPPPPPPTPEKISADAALKAFLEAPTWKSRAELVVFPDDMRASMEKRAAELGDGPIPTTSVGLTQTSGRSHIYTVCTPSIPEGFPVDVRETGDGAKVNWESFVNFHDDLFRKFAAGPAGTKGIFQVWAKMDPPTTGEAESYFARFRLSVPMPNREQYAWMKKDSIALAELRGLFEKVDKLERPEVHEFVKQVGIPVALALVKRQANDGQVFIEITDVVRAEWGPTEGGE